jgi:hypothetical protein
MLNTTVTSAKLCSPDDLSVELAMVEQMKLLNRNFAVLCLPIPSSSRVD